jgi:hypothetical protein
VLQECMFLSKAKYLSRATTYWDAVVLREKREIECALKFHSSNEWAI